MSLQRAESFLSSSHTVSFSLAPPSVKHRHWPFKALPLQFTETESEAGLTQAPKTPQAGNKRELGAVQGGAQSQFLHRGSLLAKHRSPHSPRRVPTPQPSAEVLLAQLLTGPPSHRAA